MTRAATFFVIYVAGFQLAMALASIMEFGLEKSMLLIASATILNCSMIARLVIK